MENNRMDSYWTEDRLELMQWFQQYARSLGELYEGALIMISSPHFPGRSRFIAHAVREIRNRLPAVVSDTGRGGRLDYKSKLDKILEECTTQRFMIGGADSIIDNQSTQSDIPIPLPIYIKIAALIKDHIETREKPIESATHLFVTVAPENQSLIETLRPIISHWIDVTEWFMARAHDYGIRDDENDIELYKKKFEIFETFLLALLVQKFFNRIEDLDEILEETNT